MTKHSLVTVLTDPGYAKLHEKSEQVVFTLVDDTSLCLETSTMELIEELKQYVRDNNGLGMAAIQLGVTKAIFVMRRPWKSDNIVAIINPLIVDDITDHVVMNEGCFSIPLPPGHSVLVARPSIVTVEYDTENGSHVRTRLTGMESRIFQHELDHVRGKLMIDENRFGGWGKL